MVLGASDKLIIPTKVAVIDSDESSANITLKFLMAAGVEEMQHFENVDSAIRAISDGKFNGAVIDWKIKGLSALAFLARLRRMKGFENFPIVIVSGLIKKREFKILSEYTCVQLIEKPIIQEDLESALVAVEKEKTWFENHGREIVRIVKHSGKNLEKLFQTSEKLISRSPNPEGTSMAFMKELVTQGYLDAAEVMVGRILDKDPENLNALQSLATIKSLYGHNEDALVILERAHEICPQNIERLALLGEIEISSSHPEEAIEYFQKALRIDPDYSKAKIGLIVATQMDEEDKPTRLFAGTPSVARILNNLGIVLAKRGQLDNALKYYFMSLSFLADHALQAKVSFNIGLGYTRGRKLENARKWLGKALTLSNGKMNKARSVLEVVEASLGRSLAASESNNSRILADRHLSQREVRDFEEETLRKLKVAPSENSDEEKKSLQTLFDEIDKVSPEADDSFDDAA